MKLKAGTYRFNEQTEGYFDIATTEAELQTFNPKSYRLIWTFGDFTYNSINNYFVNGTLNTPDFSMNYDNVHVITVSGDQDYTLYFLGAVSVEDNVQSGDGWTSPIFYTHDHTIEEQEVDDVVGEWYVANTNYNEVNGIVEETPIATIEYNGETIAQLNAGETATLSCKDKKMASDVVVKVNKPPIPEGYVKPEGTLEITLNNIEANPIDCSQYAKVTVNTAEPLKISDPTVLDNITDSPWGVGGSVFLYEGATTDSYENGTLYYLEDTDK